MPCNTEKITKLNGSEKKRKEKKRKERKGRKER
jgi:hypothetical protein